MYPTIFYNILQSIHIISNNMLQYTTIYCNLYIIYPTTYYNILQSIHNISNNILNLNLNIIYPKISYNILQSIHKISCNIPQSTHKISNNILQYPTISYNLYKIIYLHSPMINFVIKPFFPNVYPESIVINSFLRHIYDTIRIVIFLLFSF